MRPWWIRQEQPAAVAAGVQLLQSGARAVEAGAGPWAAVAFVLVLALELSYLYISARSLAARRSCSQISSALPIPPQREQRSLHCSTSERRTSPRKQQQ